MTNRPSTISNSDFSIEIAHLSMAYETRRVLDQIDLRIPAGESLCLCGANGAGKSTLMRIVAGLLQPTDGTIRVEGHDICKNPQAVKAILGVISHKSMLYPDLTVAENLAFVAQLYGVPNRQKRVSQLLEEVGLAGYRYDKTSILSRGMLQRLAICRAVVHQPKVLLADEPFTGLDTQACRHLVEVLRQFSDNGGTVIMTTHETNYGIQCCDRFVVLDNTKLIFDSPAEKIDREKFIQDYLSYARDSHE
ncbi:MAG: heme ABC exporter ATP-binding protein CcmA [Phycisphaerae bacterium]|nr:heme ABC exporter ATP-binding protein CcmA [Phycisphaerae bacterium]